MSKNTGKVLAMPIVLARVDDRLIHGQIVEGWAPFVHADCIIVVNDSVCCDETRCRLMRMIIPPDLGFYVIPVNRLPALLVENEQKCLLLLFDSIMDVLAALDLGIPLDSVNVGNLHCGRGGCAVGPSVFLDRGDVGAIRELFRRGIEVHVQDVPEGRSFDLEELVGREERQG